MVPSLRIGMSVVYVDTHRVSRPALVVQVWKNEGQPDGCNLVFVSGDESRTDGYGRQTEHASSVVHVSTQPAGGNSWRHVDE